MFPTLVSILSLASVTSTHSALVADAVFAHDFETVSGDTITALQGPNATKSTNVSTSTAAPVGPWSLQQIQAPNGSTFGNIDTNTRLTSAASQLSFTIAYNDRAGNSGSDGFHVSRLLTSYNGSGANTLNQLVFDLESLSGGRRLRLDAQNTFAESSVTVPFQDSTWHQAGFSFDGGVVTFYYDGFILGSPITLSGVSVIPAQTSNWLLLEDLNPTSDPREYFANGSYDDAALWNRVLSPAEMSTIKTTGLGVVPEPSTTIFGAIGILAFVFRRNRNERNG